MRIEEYLIQVAKTVSLRSTCRRQVGCVLADKQGRILATGYNGKPKTFPNCTENTCTNTSDNPGPCYAIHAEINALMFCQDIDKIYYIAVTRLPCVPCSLALLNTNCFIVIYSENNSYQNITSLLEKKFLLEQIP